MIRSSDRARLLAVSLGLVLVPTIAWAQDAPPPATDPKEMARAHGEEALALHAAGKFQEAFTKFETAERIAHSPVFVVWMARSKRAIGELRAAQGFYQRVVSEALPADASPNWQQAKAEAEVELKALSQRIPSIKVTVAAGSAVPSALTLDGAAIAIGDPIAVDPGEHRIEATSEGGAVVTRNVRVEEGQPTAIVSLDLQKTSAPAGGGGGDLVIPGAVLLGVGGASLIAGAVTGAYALVLAGEIEEGCVGNQCLATDADKADDADALARASTGTLIAGGVLAVTGIVLIAVDPGGSETALLRVGPTWAGLDIRF
ncbi:MAG: hypothetical protein HOV80_26320 [Polyangiaceae bacterium]|nr:hypothetical protein [Polyangiaceae bacterium]